MDSLTQAALGAAVGHVVADRKAGAGAMLAGAIGGTLPDLDILFYPILDSVEQLGFHRGFSHSFLFAVTGAPVFGFACSRIARSKEVSWRTWALVGFWAFVTHILLDTATVYGTGLFEPFSDSRPAWSVLFIIDPLYTLPLVVGVLGAALVRGRRKLAVTWTWVGLGVSSLYIMWAGIAKTIADRAIQHELDRLEIPYTRLMTTPTPFNTVLWRGLAESNDRFVEIYYSLARGAPVSEASSIPKNHADLLPVRNTRAADTAVWFSKGYYAVGSDGDTVLLHDLRFGRIGFGEGPFALSLAFIDEEGSSLGLEQRWGWTDEIGPVLGEIVERAF